MENLQNLNRKSLLDVRLVKLEYRKQLASIIQKVDNPVSFLVSNGYIKNGYFFKNLAETLGLQYFSDLPKPISTHASVAQQIPAKILIDNMIYAFEVEGRLLIATMDPFQERGVYKNILSYTSYNDYELVISNPNEIRNAQTHSYYYDLTITSEELISIVNPNQSAKTFTTLIIPKIFPIFTVTLFAMLFFVYPRVMFLFSFVILNIFYFLINPFKIYTFLRSLKPKRSLYFSQIEVDQIIDSELPRYTILVPLRHEAVMAKQIVKNILDIDYPIEKLDIKFVVDVDDQSTIDALEQLGLGKSSDDASKISMATQLVKVPKGTISTKPRATDYALNFARGRYVTIYDAEDKPDKDQLKKCYLAFQKSSLDTITIQSRLNYYNARQNILTKLFSLEYGFWFDFYLPGLQEIGSPIPLGGTSNHFVTSFLKKIGAWDAFNVTEDADLGLRIYRNRLKTAVVNSNTLEEANSDLFGWVRQRTRWQKGFLVTFLVHTSRPQNLIEDLGVLKFLYSLLTFGGNFFLPLLNPILWIIFVFSFVYPLNEWFVFRPNSIIVYISTFNLVVGNLSYIVVHFISAIKHKTTDLAPLVLLLPLYWLLISVATIRATIQFFIKPYYWEKTKHGLIR